MTAVSAVTASGDQDIDGLLWTSKWAIQTLTFSFPPSASFYEQPYGGAKVPGFPANTSDQFAPMNSAEQNAVRSILQLISNVANLTFTEITETPTTHADLRFGTGKIGGLGYAVLPTSDPAGGDVWINNDWPPNFTVALGDGESWAGFTHEI